MQTILQAKSVLMLHFFQTALDITEKNKANVARNLPPNGFDTLILRFRGYWDDRNQMEGELHFYEVLYHLVDDTMELVEEIIDENKVTGIRRKIIVKRQRLPKVSIQIVCYITLDTYTGWFTKHTHPLLLLQ